MNLRWGRQERDTYKQIFLSTAAASSVLLAVAAVPPAVFSWATRAEAATNVSASINFYDELAPHGNWVSYQNRYVWIAEDVDDSWRPYTVGHWAYTRLYGWMWMSDEKFGWATYHYGRWGQAPDIGWYWAPGRRWAPAWVAWRYDDSHIAWAPLPPDGDDGINIDDIPDHYWQAVPVSAFLSDDLSGHVYRDRDGARHGKPQTVHILNNIVMNNVIKVDDIEKKTKKKVVVLEEKAVGNPDAAGKAFGNSVAIFSPEMKVIQAPAPPKPALPPSKTVNLDKVDYDQSGNIVFGGRGPAGSKVLLFVDNKAYGLAFIDDMGSWTFAGLSPLTAGLHALRADEIGGDGAVKGRIEMPFYREEPARVAAAPLTPATPVAATAQEVPIPKMKATAAPDQPAEVQTASIEKINKKKAEEPANTKRKVQPECDPALADCPPAQTLSKPKYQSTKRVQPMTNLRGAESWRIICSPRFGGFTKASETYLSSAGKRVSCAMRPKNARG